MSELALGSSLFKLYHSLVKLEGETLKDNKYCTDLTVNELNLLECIRSLTKGGEGPTISMIARYLDITRPSTTVAINKLCNKKIATKSDCAKDGRSVRVSLTSKGEKAYNAHHTYQNALIKTLKQEYSEAEFEKLTGALSKLGEFFNEKLGDEE